MLKWLGKERMWRQLHFYLAIILVLQCIAWFASGFLMALLPIEQVRGDPLRSTTIAANWSLATVAPATILARYPSAELRFTQKTQQPVYQINYANQQIFIDAQNGQTLAPLRDDEVRQLAQHDWRGIGDIAAIALLDKTPQEVRGLTPPLWQVIFDDTNQSRFYLHATTGELLRVRTNQWRLYDFFWMLHIMDYQNRSNFNHPLLIVSSATALLFTISALPLLWWRLRRLRRVGV